MHNTAPRLTGTLTTWHDDRGFGFIEPTQGGQALFVHIKAFGDRAGRPQLGQVLSFGVEIAANGKKRATQVQPLRATSTARPRPRVNSPVQWGTATVFAIPAFALLLLVVAVLWRVPHWVPVLYVVASGVCYLAYWQDKEAAQRQRWRTPESTLLMLGLVGGWPGAIVAQQGLRHKSSKASFRAAFWLTVVLNVLGFVSLTTPLGTGLRALTATLGYT